MMLPNYQTRMQWKTFFSFLAKHSNSAVSGSGSGSGVIFVDSGFESESVDLEGVRQPRASSSSDSLSKAVSSNITNILESLLKNYDKTERPSFQNGEPTKVNVNILIRSMGPISEMQMVRVCDHEQIIEKVLSVLLHGLLLSTILERSETQLQRT